MDKNEFKGFSLFSDIKDKELRNMNRAKVLANVAESNTRDRKVTPQAAAIILGYFNILPDEDKDDVRDKFKTNMEQRGYVLS